MEKKSQFIIMGLAGFLLISVFVGLQTFAAKKTLERERDDLRSQNASLTKDLEENQKATQQLRENITALAKDLDRISQEKEEIRKQKDEAQKQQEEVQERYKAMAKERDGLADKLKEQPDKQAKKAEPPATQDAYWAGILKANAELSLKVENMRNELKTLKINNEQMSIDLNNLTREKQEIDQQFQYNQKMFDNMATELVIERNSRRTLEDNLRTLRSENAILRRQLKSLNSRKTGLENKLIKLQEEKDTLENRFNEMAGALEDRLSKITGLSKEIDTVRSGSGGEIKIAQPEKETAPKRIEETNESVELPPIVVRPQSEKTTSQKEILSGEGCQVLEINRDNNFVVIDIGQDTGLKIGQVLRVFRGDIVIANISVVQVRKNISACDIKGEFLPIIVGDKVIK